MQPEGVAAECKSVAPPSQWPETGVKDGLLVPWKCEVKEETPPFPLATLAHARALPATSMPGLSLLSELARLIGGNAGAPLSTRLGGGGYRAAVGAKGLPSVGAGASGLCCRCHSCCCCWCRCG